MLGLKEQINLRKPLLKVVYFRDVLKRCVEWCKKKIRRECRSNAWWDASFDRLFIDSDWFIISVTWHSLRSTTLFRYSHGHGAYIHYIFSPRLSESTISSSCHVQRRILPIYWTIPSDAKRWWYLFENVDNWISVVGLISVPWTLTQLLLARTNFRSLFLLQLEIIFKMIDNVFMVIWIIS